jgi:hypothetical protein
MRMQTPWGQKVKKNEIQNCLTIKSGEEMNPKDGIHILKVTTWIIKEKKKVTTHFTGEEE